ncbi:hypothetical protein QJS04_geneDACA018627 [Acorus gramineus]|uniref:RCC1-like domain-containing protein n=1 Tax=Acorus gramineus TaxID=55184 RepID=A0AAV9AI35_ACOGR|nr:hypothetical protein QJS04_geneDACA018627 [Acorus gramineus]
MSNLAADGGDEEAAVVAEGPPATQEWWSWGAGTEGQLATGDLVDHHSPQPLPSKTIISHIACGGAHAVALTDEGKVMSWGRGGCGQLGHGDRKNCLKPKFVEAVEGITVCDVSAGWSHSGFVSDTGCLFTCGDGSFGQLGHGDYQSHCYPVQVQHVVSKHVTQIACGMRHSLVLVKGPSENIVYAFGSGRRGQLGASLNGSRSSCLPVIVNELENHGIAHIYANGDHSAALSANGSLYTWGRGYSGVSDTCVPQMLDFPFKISEVALGWDHALLLTDARELFMLGGIRHGMLSGPQQKSMGQQMPLARCTSSDVHLFSTKYLFLVG